MSTDTTINVPAVCAESKDITAECPDMQSNAFRVYKYSPTGSLVQIRSFGTITRSRSGNARQIISNVHMSADQLREAITAMQAVLEEIINQ